MKTNKEHNMFCSFFVSRSLFLGAGMSLIISYGEKDTWLAILLGYLLGIGIIYIFTYLNNTIGTSLHDYLQKNNILNLFLKSIMFLYYIFLIFVLLLLFSTFIFSYYLPFTHSFISCLPFILLAVFLSNKKTSTIAKICQILFFIAIFLILSKYLMLFPKIKVDNFLPILTTYKKDLFLTIIIFTTLSVSPYLTMLGEKINLKTNLKSYSLSCLTIFIMIITITGSHSSEFARAYSYPEFTMLRQINLLNFIENIESFLGINWMFDSFIAMTLSFKKIKEVVNYKNNFITYIIALIILILTSLYFNGDYIPTIFIYKNFTLILIIFVIAIFVLLGIKKGFSTKSSEKYK